MAYTLDTSQASKLVFIASSRVPVARQLGSNTSLVIQLNQPLTCHPHEHFLVSLYSASIPMSFYNTTDSENKFTIWQNGLEINGSITPGNYNIRQYLDAFALTIGAYYPSLTVTYSAVTNKVTFRDPMATSPYNIRLTTVGKTLGFNNGDVITITPGGSVTSPGVVNVYDRLSIYLRTSLAIANNLDEAGVFSDILERIPIRSPNSIVVYEPPNQQHRNLIDQKVITSFTLSLTDEFGEPLDLGGQNWECCLKFDTVAYLSRQAPVGGRDELDGF